MFKFIFTIVAVFGVVAAHAQDFVRSDVLYIGGLKRYDVARVFDQQPRGHLPRARYVDDSVVVGEIRYRSEVDGGTGVAGDHAASVEFSCVTTQDRSGDQPSLPLGFAFEASDGGGGSADEDGEDADANVPVDALVVRFSKDGNVFAPEHSWDMVCPTRFGALCSTDRLRLVEGGVAFRAFPDAATFLRRLVDSHDRGSRGGGQILRFHDYGDLSEQPLPPPQWFVLRVSPISTREESRMAWVEFRTNALECAGF